MMLGALRKACGNPSKSNPVQYRPEGDVISQEDRMRSCRVFNKVFDEMADITGKFAYSRNLSET